MYTYCCGQFCQIIMQVLMHTSPYLGVVCHFCFFGFWGPTIQLPNKLTHGCLFLVMNDRPLLGLFLVNVLKLSCLLPLGIYLFLFMNIFLSFLVHDWLRGWVAVPDVLLSLLSLLLFFLGSSFCLYSLSASPAFPYSCLAFGHSSIY